MQSMNSVFLSAYRSVETYKYMRELIIKEIIEDYLNSVNISDIELIAKDIDPTIDKTQHLSMRTCFSCNKNFTNYECKKYFCQFCYKAFCSKCSMLTLLHPETKKNERCCNSCILSSIQKPVLQLAETFATKQMQAEIQERLTEEHKQNLLQEQIHLLESEIHAEHQRFTFESNLLDQQITKMETKIKEKIVNLRQIQRKNETKEEEIKTYTKNESADYINQKLNDCLIH